MIKKILLSLLLFSPVFGDQVAVSKFGTLNNNNSPPTISPEMAQDLLNVDITPGGLSVKKRMGYGVYKALATGQAMHGGYHAFDSSGNDYQLWGSSTSLFGIVSDGTPLQLISSVTLNSTWDCTDAQANSYCVNSNRDLYLRTNGTTKTWFASPLGTMVETTPDRVVVAGVSGSPSTLFVSQSNTFTNFTVGTNATDAFTEVIASPGSRITHIRWGCGKLLWWKDSSFGYFDFDDQFSAQVKTVSDVIGTFDNTSAIDPGGRVWFRGQDGHTWMYNCSVLEKKSVDITQSIQSSGRRVANAWAQTSQADFQTGTIVPTGYLSTTLSPGDVVPSSFTAIENSQAAFTQGTFNNMTTGAQSGISNRVLQLATNNSGSINDFNFESGSDGSPISGADWACTGGTCLTYKSSRFINPGCTISPFSGSRMGEASVSNPVLSSVIRIRDYATNTVLAENTIPTADTGCAWVTGTLASAGYVGTRFYLEARITNSGTTYEMRTTSGYILGGDITYHYNIGTTAGTSNIELDRIENGSSTIASGSYTSKYYDTGFTSSTVRFTADYVANTVTPNFGLQSSTATNGAWGTLTTSPLTDVVANRYIRYVSTISPSSSDSALTTISTVTLYSVSSGTYYSSVHNAPNLTGWSTLGVNFANNGGAETFYVRAATQPYSVLSATPSWVAQTAGSLITVSTGTYFQFRDDFANSVATNTPSLNDFTVNFFEGNATDQAYMLYFDNAIWQSVTFSAGQSINNYIFKYDLINDGWTLYNFGAGGLLSTASTLYFGDPTSGNIFNFGTTTADNGTAINAFWRSKSFTGADPFLQSSLTNIDTFAKKNQGSALTASYTIENSTSTSYSVSLSTGNTAFIQSRKLLPSGKTGYTFDIKYGDTSTSSAWEILGFRIGFTQQPYRPTQ